MNGGEPLSDAEMTKAIRLCFKYTQDRVREQYYDYLVNEKKKEIVKRKMEQAKRKAEEIERNSHRLNTKFDMNNFNQDDSFKRDDQKYK